MEQERWGRWRHRKNTISSLDGHFRMPCNPLLQEKQEKGLEQILMESSCTVQGMKKCEGDYCRNEGRHFKLLSKEFSEASGKRGGISDTKQK